MKDKRIYATYKTGLTNQEVQQKVQVGLVNVAQQKVTKSTVDIVKDNVFTLFNLLNILIGIALATVGAFSNMFYLIVILINILIGIVQEIQAKRLVEKLSIITIEKVSVVRDSKIQDLRIENLVQDDIVILKMGDQISADAYVIEDEIEVNESLLTGESDVIVKKKGDFLYSGSFVVGGKAYARIERVGKDSFSSKIVSEVKQHKRTQSELIGAIAKISKFTSYVIIPFGIILFLQAYFLRDSSIFDAVVNTAAALLGMLPKGLVLLIGIASATGVIKLSKKKVLVQDMHSMETFAHVDVLCLDKTGTITEGNMKVTKVHSFGDKDVTDLMSYYIQAVDDNNATYTAMRNYFKAVKMNYFIESKIPFTSQRKWGCVIFDELGSIVVGAPEWMVKKDDIPEVVWEAQKNGARVLLVAHTSKKVTSTLPELDIVGMIELEDPIRNNAPATFAYFKKEGVQVKVISGDNPITVSNVARKAGLEDYANYVDLSEVTSEEKLYELAFSYSVFGRVSPKQKQILVKAFQQYGHTVAMSGDGVNDVLALREADCSIAMAEGSAAAKQISQLVLLDSDFSSLINVLSEGRRTINNITKVSSIFFIKTIYSVLLSVLCILMNMPFPFIPLQITLIDLIIEGYPSFFLSFEEDKTKLEGSYLKTALRKALPNAIIIILNIIAVLLLERIFVITQDEVVTIMFVMVGFISILAVLKACLPFNTLRFFLFISVSILFCSSLFIFDSILGLSWSNPNTFFIIMILMICSLLSWILFQYIEPKPMYELQEDERG
ncbi:cation-transporting ATPase E [Breznakia sp. PF5-3]|uniref:HAD-IC family P-type ATPase n=1 Tax=unclassified Breznakia TaxID=2623764 RepID=UPI002405229D|nr:MULTISPECIES: HAD-IC family P-type ATPase [unclassified Breznakia]MDF9824254.1 cation-transporting ATPase E [Breznakia sp. PM6-1]MDF9835179.1 cation-transporting ATPase E [Breznakia sp. PF5-3]MDF9837291.1 cation-transporting ATPase E [Breznakia sp. PFB2-8]MDF9859426.1 cation-transporting ATPase E [Breznakia sp. PH5-24]